MGQKFLERWHQMVAQKDPAVLADLVAEGAQLYSPAFWKPKQGKAAVLAIFGAVMTVVEDFRYTGEWLDGDHLILLFEGHLGDKSVRGIDRIRLDSEGRLVECEVFVRPMTGLASLAEAMGKALAPPS